MKGEIDNLRVCLFLRDIFSYLEGRNVGPALPGQ